MGEQSHAVERLRPVTFRYRNDPRGTLQYGLVAEEVATVFPELVVRNADGTIETVRYESLVPMLLNEVQRLNTQVVELRSLQQELAGLRAQMASRTTSTAVVASSAH